jgi:hypothetical protein
MTGILQAGGVSTPKRDESLPAIGLLYVYAWLSLTALTPQALIEDKS